MDDLEEAAFGLKPWALPLLVSLVSTTIAQAGNPPYALDRGEVKISGETNLFPYSARSTRFEGCVWPREGNLYQGDIRMAISSFVFSLPFAADVIESEEQFDTTRYPYVNLRLNSLRPIPGKRQVNGLLEVRGERRPVNIEVDVSSTDSGIFVNGHLELKQSDFGVIPFAWGMLRVADEIDIDFEAAFNEISGPVFPAIAAMNADISCFP